VRFESQTRAEDRQARESEESVGDSADDEAAVGSVMGSDEVFPPRRPVMTRGGIVMYPGGSPEFLPAEPARIAFARLRYLRDIAEARIKARLTLDRIIQRDPEAGDSARRIFNRIMDRLTSFKVMVSSESPELRSPLGHLAAGRMFRLRRWLEQIPPPGHMPVPPVGARWADDVTSQTVRAVYAGLVRLEFGMNSPNGIGEGYEVWCASVIELGEEGLSISDRDREVLIAQDLILPRADASVVHRHLRRIGLQEVAALLAMPRSAHLQGLAIDDWQKVTAKAIRDIEGILDDPDNQDLELWDGVEDALECATISGFLDILEDTIRTPAAPE